MRVLLQLIVVLMMLEAAAPRDVQANVFACCTPQGTCEELTADACEESQGISVFGSTCADSPCNVMVPAASLPAVLTLATILLTLAIYGLMRRAGRT